MPSKKIARNRDVPNMDDAADKAKSYFDKFFERFIGDISKTSATKQLAVGVTTGWCTGVLAMRVGKTAALALGGGIILVQIASEKGYIKVHWDRINRKVTQIADDVDEKITGDAPQFMDKVERYVDRTVDKAENTFKRNRSKAKSWFASIMGESDCQLKEIHIFLVSFVAGVAIGIGTS